MPNSAGIWKKPEKTGLDWFYLVWVSDWPNESFCKVESGDWGESDLASHREHLAHHLLPAVDVPVSFRSPGLLRPPHKMKERDVA
jgi:hypothetical protein